MGVADGGKRERVPSSREPFAPERIKVDSRAGGSFATYHLPEFSTCSVRVEGIEDYVDPPFLHENHPHVLLHALEASRLREKRPRAIPYDINNDSYNKPPDNVNSDTNGPSC